MPDNHKPLSRRISDQDVTTLDDIFTGFGEWYRANYDQDGNFIGTPWPTLKVIGINEEQPADKEHKA